ncbi:hypothetical protein [Photobacterium leiognathi]|uniref:hypothetical protein n=1 Tax=Photobacterium leiognathi TaxID=553611 RepID=UPI0027398C50|nr:hypothetical protein [Photobacterium leiognathi]
MNDIRALLEEKLRDVRREITLGNSHQVVQLLIELEDRQKLFEALYDKSISAH